MTGTSRPLRLMIYDETCRSGYGPVGLTHSWIIGKALYRALGRLDAVCGVKTWNDGLTWLANHETHREIGEIQFWGHGHWGCAMIDRESLDIHALEPGHPLYEPLCTIRKRLASPESLWWFRTCETFGADAGQDFAERWTRFMGCRAAGHTFIIGPWQSGLHCLEDGATPSWSPTEGLREGTAAKPQRAFRSRPWKPNTITCLHGAIPSGF